jgi:hypothetical protein
MPRALCPTRSTLRSSAASSRRKTVSLRPGSVRFGIPPSRIMARFVAERFDTPAPRIARPIPPIAYPASRISHHEFRGSAIVAPGSALENRDCRERDREWTIRSANASPGTNSLHLPHGRPAPRRPNRVIPRFTLLASAPVCHLFPSPGRLPSRWHGGGGGPHFASPTRLSPVTPSPVHTAFAGAFRFAPCAGALWTPRTQRALHVPQHGRTSGVARP